MCFLRTMSERVSQEAGLAAMVARRLSGVALVLLGLSTVIQAYHVEARGPRKCFKRSAWVLGVAESASCVAHGGLGPPRVLQAKRLEAWGSPKVLQRGWLPAGLPASLPFISRCQR